jgi:hypothetical protein
MIKCRHEANEEAIRDPVKPQAADALGLCLVVQLVGGDGIVGLCRIHHGAG